MKMVNPIGAVCIIKEPGGREFTCRIRKAIMREMIGTVPELDVTLQVETISEATAFAPWERKYNYISQPPEFPAFLRYGTTTPPFRHKAKKVIFNPPATVVFWSDGTKTVVKCDPDDSYNEMTGVALCYMKKALGNTSRELNKALRNAKGAKA